MNLKILAFGIAREIIGQLELSVQLGDTVILNRFLIAFGMTFITKISFKLFALSFKLSYRPVQMNIPSIHMDQLPCCMR